MTRKIIVTAALVVLMLSSGLAQLSIGVDGAVGHTASKSEQLEFNHDKLYRNDFLSNFKLGGYAEYRFGNWASTLGMSYHSQTLKFNDPNTEYFSGGQEKLSVKQSTSSIALSLGGKRFFPLNDKTDLYGGLGLNFDFYNTASSSIASTVNYTLLGPVNLTTQAGVASGVGIGLMPEAGVSFKVGEKSSLIFYGALNVGLNETLNGVITRDVVINQVPQGSYTSNSSNASVGVKYQYNFKATSSAEKQRVAVAKEENRKAKEAEALRKKQEKELLKQGADIHDDKKVTFGANGMPEKLDDRVIEKQKEVVVQSTEIEFLVWDDKQEDKDSISLYINGVWVLKEYELVNKKKVVRVTIDPDKDNYLIMYALNEGKFPPNTCALSINDGVSGEKRLNLKSTLKSCGAIQFHYKPKQK